MSARHVFLSAVWFEAVQPVLAGQSAPTEATVVMNVVVVDAPFDTDPSFHVGAADGTPLLAAGHVDTPDLSLTTDYATARDLFLAGEPAAAMQAFMAGKIKLQGDLAKLMSVGAGLGGGGAQLTAALQAITE
jgi:hypothetical protein